MRALIERTNPVLQRSKIRALQEVMRGMPQIKEELFHHFCDGLYGREMRVPAGTILVGKTHKKPCLNFIMQGIVEVRAPDGSYHIEAPHVFASPAGTKRAMVAITDLIWVTVHPASTTDLEALEADLIEDES